MGESKVVAGGHFGIFPQPAGHCGGGDRGAAAAGAMRGGPARRGGGERTGHTEGQGRESAGALGQTRHLRTDPRPPPSPQARTRRAPLLTIGERNYRAYGNHESGLAATAAGELSTLPRLPPPPPPARSLPPPTHRRRQRRSAAGSAPPAQARDVRRGRWEM